MFSEKEIKLDSVISRPLFSQRENKSRKYSEEQTAKWLNDGVDKLVNYLAKQPNQQAPYTGPAAAFVRNKLSGVNYVKYVQSGANGIIKEATRRGMIKIERSGDFGFILILLKPESET